jgi:hypothetical protein
MPANSFLIRAVSSLMISAISDSNVLGKAVSLAESAHPIILETSWDFSSGQLLFSKKLGGNPAASLVSGLSDSLASQVRLSARQRLRRPNC